MKYLALALVALAAMVPVSEGNESLRANVDVSEDAQRMLGKGKGKGKGKGDHTPHPTEAPTPHPTYDGKGKGKGKGKGTPHPTAAPTEEEHPLFYAKGGGGKPFNLNPDCDDPLCVGTVLVFKEPIFFDAHFNHDAGYIIGQCIVPHVTEEVEPKVYPATKKPYPTTTEAHPTTTTTTEAEVHSTITDKKGYERKMTEVEEVGDDILYCVYTLVLDYEVEHEPFKAEIAVQGYGVVGGVGVLDTFLITAAAGKYEGEKGEVISTTLESGDTLLKLAFYDD